MKLHSVSFGAACGLLLGSAVAAASAVCWYRVTQQTPPAKQAGQTLRGLAAVFRGYNPYRMSGIWIGLAWGTAYGFVGGLVFALVYNLLVGILGGSKG